MQKPKRSLMSGNKLRVTLLTSSLSCDNNGDVRDGGELTPPKLWQRPRGKSRSNAAAAARRREVEEAGRALIARSPTSRRTQGRRRRRGEATRSRWWRRRRRIEEVYLKEGGIV